MLVTLIACGVAGCASQNTGPKVGTVTGTVTAGSTPIAGVTVTATVDATHVALVATTAGDGTYTIPNVPVGSGTVLLSTLPAKCGAPQPLPYDLVNGGGTKIVNVGLACAP